MSTKRYIDLIVEAALVCRQRRGLARGIYFPPELVDHICSYLSGDLLSLRHCSLVCRSWAVTSSRYLFRKASIPLCPSELCSARNGLFVSRMESVLHRFHTTTRFSGIRDLRLSCTCASSQHTYGSGLRYKLPISVANLRDLLASLPHLKNLELSHGSMQSASSPLPCLDGPRRLDKIVFISGGDAAFNPGPYVEILQLFESISETEFHHLPDPGLAVRGIHPTRPSNPAPSNLPRVQSLQFLRSSSEAVAAVLEAMVARIDMLSIRNLAIQNTHFRPMEMLQTALPQFLSLCVSLETLTCDPRLLRFARQVALPNLCKLEIHGKLRLDETQRCTFWPPGEPPRLTSVNVLRSGWLEIFHAIPHLDLPSLQTIYIHYDLTNPKLSQATAERGSAGASGTDLLNTLNSPVADFWPFLDRLIGRAKFISVHMELHLPSPDVKEQYLQIIQVIAETRMSDVAKGAIQFYVS